MKFVNLTNNAIKIFDAAGNRVLFEIPTDPRIVTDAKVRADVADEIIDDNTGTLVTVVRHRYTLIDSLPKEEPGTIYVVGWAVIQAMDETGIVRGDLVAPDTSRESAVRDKKTGRIIGVRQFRVL